MSAAKDWTGVVVGQAVVLRRDWDKQGRRTEAVWALRCPCGQETHLGAVLLKKMHEAGTKALCSSCYNKRNSEFKNRILFGVRRLGASRKST